MFYGDLNRWFIGVVKSINDPITSGRVQVRIFGIHGSSQEDIPDKKLPWAQVLTPVTEGGTNGLGNILGIQVGARVFGIFLDGKNSQIPFIIGSLNKRNIIPQSKVTNIINDPCDNHQVISTPLYLYNRVFIII